MGRGGVGKRAVFLLPLRHLPPLRQHPSLPLWPGSGEGERGGASMQGLCPPFQFSILSEGAWLLPAAASQNCDKGDAPSPRRTRARGPSQPYAWPHR